MLLDDSDLVFINEEFYTDAVDPVQLDTLLAEGWRHFGINFFRYSLAIYETDIRRVLPLRIRLDNFSVSKSQRRVLNRNSDLQVAIRTVEVTDECCELFERHKLRFKTGIPDSVYDFISGDSTAPCTTREMAVHSDDKLVAVSYFDIAERSVSAVYGMFDPDLSSRGLGIFTMLKEIQFAIELKKEFYYPGYAYEGNSFYDYKKRFRGLEEFDWRGTWTPRSECE